MPPQPKRKQQKSSAPSILKPPNNTAATNQVETAKLTLTSEQEQQFESELCWCIQQLQIALSSGKLNDKQVQDHSKTLNILINNKSSIIKKRQIMRTSFGDYRTKMAAEEKKNKVTMKFETSVQPNKKSIFIKKAAHRKPPGNEKESNQNLYCRSSNNKFRFNFSIVDNNI